MDDYRLNHAKRLDLIISNIKQNKEWQLNIQDLCHKICDLIQMPNKVLWDLIEKFEQMDLIEDLTGGGLYVTTQKGEQYSFVEVLTKERENEQRKIRVEETTIESNNASVESLRLSKKSYKLSIVAIVISIIQLSKK